MACTAGDPDLAADPEGFRNLDEGLELHWTFEDSVGSQILDLSGNGRHGTLQAGAALIASPDGQAVSLDGVNDYVSLVGPRSPALYGGADGSFTISAKIKVADTSKYNTLCYGCGPFSFMYAGTETYGAVLMSGLDDQSSTAKKWALSSTTLSDDAWTEVTLVVEDGASARYYVDCALGGQLDDANIGLEDPGFSAVGLSSNPARWFGGEIDELRVWNRALDDEDLAQLCPVGPPLQQGLELHWTFEDRSGNQILDISGNDRHGQNLGGSFVASPNEGEALSLDGIDDKVSFVGPRALSIYGGTSGDFTLSARVRVADADKYNSLCFGCGPFKTMYVGDPNPGGRVLSNLVNLDTQANLWATSTPSLVADEWVEITLVVEGGNEARTYLDCGLDSTLSGYNVGLLDPGYSVIGESANPAWWFGGELDELRVWSRALSEAELELVCSRALCDGPIYVDADASPGGDGTSWATAFDTVQAGLDAAAECADPRLWLAEGQYAPDPAQPVATVTYPVAIYGGFAGVELTLGQRDVAAHPVRLGADGWTSVVVDIDGATTEPGDEVRLDGVTIAGGQTTAIDIAGAPSQGAIELANLTVTDNTGATAVVVGADVAVEISSSSFERNESGDRGGALDVRAGSVTILDSSFVDNQAFRGGAVHLREPTAAHHISGTTFTGNAADWAGALFVDDDPAVPGYVELTVVDSEFSGNFGDAGAGAVYLEESTVSFDSVVFTDNTSRLAGALMLANASLAVDPGTLEIKNSRFIGNQASNGNSGALRLQDAGATVINTEFVQNQASTVGGAVWGRGHFISSTFANNVANSGSALYAPAGADMYMEHCVAYPDTIYGANIYAPYSCMTQNNALLGGPQTQLVNTDPFEPADLDEDGRTEHYLLPDGPCTGLDGGSIDAYDWDSLTVRTSQCTDDGWPEPGVHYQPQSAVGPCGEPGVGSEPMVALFPVNNANTNEDALYYMRLDDPDPLSTLDLLIAGAKWREEEYSDSNGRFVSIEVVNPSQTAYVDFGQDPPAIHEFVVPGDSLVFHATLLDDSSGWLVASLDNVDNSRALWRVPILSDGSPGTPELLTPQSQPGESFLIGYGGWAISADMSTLAIGGYDSGDPNRYRMYTIDLIDPSDSPIFGGYINQDHVYSSPHGFHLTPDGGELLFSQSYAFGIELWWMDIDGGGDQQLLGEGRMRKWIDGRTGVWRNINPTADTWVEVGEDSITTTLIDAPGANEQVYFLEGGARVMIWTNQQVGSVYAGPPLGPYTPIFGGAAGDDPVNFGGVLADGEYVLVNYKLPNNHYDVTIHRMNGNQVVDTALIATDSTNPAKWWGCCGRAVVEFNGVAQYWKVDLDDIHSIEQLTGVLPAAASGLSQQWAVDYSYLLRSDNVDRNYYLIPTAAPGNVELVDMSPYKPWRSAVTAPYEKLE